MVFTQFMYRLVRVVAFGFKALNFCLDLWQTWQFAGGGGAVVITTAVIAYFQDKPMWLIVVLAIAAGVLLVCLASLIFKSYALKVTERRRLERLSRLVYDMHKRRCAVREKFISKIDWGKVDFDKVFTPFIALFPKDDQGIVINDDSLNDVWAKLDEIGSIMHGPGSMFTTVMKSSDTDLEKAIERDFRYKVMHTRLDSYKPYPSESIRGDVERVIDGSKILNDLILAQAYIPDSLSLESLSEHTKLSDIKKGQVYLANANIKEIMDSTIDKATVKLREHIEEYLRSKEGTK